MKKVTKLDDYGRAKLYKAVKNAKADLQYLVNELNRLENSLDVQNFDDESTFDIEIEFVLTGLKIAELSKGQLEKNFKKAYKTVFLQEVRKDFTYSVIY